MPNNLKILQKKENIKFISEKDQVNNFLHLTKHFSFQPKL